MLALSSLGLSITTLALRYKQKWRPHHRDVNGRECGPRTHDSLVPAALCAGEGWISGQVLRARVSHKAQDLEGTCMRRGAGQLSGDYGRGVPNGIGWHAQFRFRRIVASGEACRLFGHRRLRVMSAMSAEWPGSTQCFTRQPFCHYPVCPSVYFVSTWYPDIEECVSLRKHWMKHVTFSICYAATCEAFKTCCQVTYPSRSRDCPDYLGMMS